MQLLVRMCLCTWFANEAAIKAVQVKESSFSDANPTPAMMGSKQR